MIFQGKNYELVVGKPIPGLKTVRFIFEGWTDEDERKKYYGDIGCFEVENGARRAVPPVKAAQAIFKLITWKDEQAPREEMNNPPIGTVCDITYYWEMATPEEIREFFAAHGIALRPADPFQKPQKTMTWLAYWKWKLLGKGFPGKERFPSVIIAS